ncbi:MAG: glucose-1-phosphate adenylyltransferase family protein [Bacillota bacterium]
MKTKVIAMVLVGGRGTRLHPITKRKAKPAVTFGGKYKLVDFVLSNLTNALYTTVGVVTQYEPYSLMNYIQHGATWDLDIPDGGIHFLTPYTSYEGDRWQKGTAHAVRQHQYFIDHYNPEYVLILSGDHVYKMDYNTLVEAHEQSGAEITLSVFKPDNGRERFGVVEIDEDGCVTGFEEKPENPKSPYASMGVYVFNKDTLKAILNDEERETFDFGKHIIPKALAKGHSIHSFIFDGYFRDVGTVESLYETNMDLLDHPEYIKLNDYSHLPLYTRSSDMPPHHVMRHDLIKNSLISDGCLVSGSVVHSILSNGVAIKEDAHVEDSLIFQDAVVGENSRIKNAIILEDTIILPNTNLEFDEVTVIDNDTLWALGGENDA